MIIACAKTASTAAQLEVARALLQTSLDELSSGVDFSIEGFVLYRLLANIYHLMGEPGKYVRSFETAVVGINSASPRNINNIDYDTIILDAPLFSFI